MRYLGSTSDAAVASDGRKWQNETTALVILLFHPVNNSCSQSGYESTLACVNAGNCSVVHRVVGQCNSLSLKNVQAVANFLA
jgi:hypothetical protein